MVGYLVTMRWVDAVGKFDGGGEKQWPLIFILPYARFKIPSISSVGGDIQDQSLATLTEVLA